MVRALVCPGQGSQSIGMGKLLADEYSSAKAVLEEVDDALGENLSSLIWEGDIDELTLTQNAQPALMAMSLAALRGLESEGFKILEYAPEDGFLFTDYKEFNWGTGRRFIAVTAHVHDKIVVTGMGSMDIPVSDLGKPEDLLKIKKMDRLPYLIQKKTFLSLTQPFEDIGLVRIYN